MTIHPVTGIEQSGAAERKARILIVEDDRDLNNLLKFNLESTKDFQVFSHFEGNNAFAMVLEFEPDLVILDVMLPGMYGTEILKKIRADKKVREVPVILLTARSQEEDKIGGFEAGADDYITKPFSPRELLLRVHALLRRSHARRYGIESQTGNDKNITVGPIVIHPEEYKVLVNGEGIALTATEYQLLVYLAERSGKLQSREALLEKVWGYEGNVNTRTVDTHVKRLRQKLGPTAGPLIETVHGFGYRLVDSSHKTTQKEQLAELKTAGE